MSIKHHLCFRSAPGAGNIKVSQTQWCAGKWWTAGSLSAVLT